MVDLQVDELAFVVFHDCGGYGDLEEITVVAGAIIERCIGGKHFGAWSRLASWRFFSLTECTGELFTQQELHMRSGHAL